VLISSRNNPRVKQIRALRDRKERDRTSLFLAEGSRLVRDAIETEAGIETLIVVTERLGAGDPVLIDAAVAAGAEVLEVTPAVYSTIATREDPQALAAVCWQQWQSLGDAGRRCWVALHDIQHPGNLGTIIRTNDAIGGDGVILSGRSTDPYHPIAVRGSLGAIFSQRIIRAEAEELAAWLKLSGCHVVGTSPSGEKDYREAEYRAPVVVMGGNERAGISEAQSALCDAVVRIPMAGRVESLNLAIATALVLYEVHRQVAG
jgi:TrmH family RNA methyltransferase